MKLRPRTAGGVTWEMVRMVLALVTWVWMLEEVVLNPSEKLTADWSGAADL